MRPSIPTSALLDTASEIVGEVGFARVRMDAVATRAGVAKGVPYGRFPSKDALLLAMIDREIAEAIQHSLDLVAGDPEGGRFSRLWLHSSSALTARPVLQRLYTDSASPLAAAAASRRDRLGARSLLGADFIRQLQHADLVEPDLDPDALATNLTLWNYALSAGAPGNDLPRLILGMSDVLARAADTGRGDLDRGAALYARFAEQLIAERRTE